MTCPKEELFLGYNMNSIMEAVRLVCNEVRNNSKHGTSFQKLLTTLRREFKKQDFKIKITSERDKHLAPEEFYVNAYYDPDDDSKSEIAIEVIVHHNFDKDNIWDKVHVTDFLIQIFDATVHEFKHQRQSKKRYFQIFLEHPGTEPYRDYLQDPDEIDAYSLSIAIELCRTLGKFRALRYMPTFTKLARFKIQNQFVSPNLHAYVSHFETLNTPILKRLAKKVYVRLQKLDTDAIFV